MGPTTRRNDLAKLVEEKDAQITRLESQIQVYAARASQTQTRLLSTLETMDELRGAHARELAAEQRTNERLSSKMRRYRDYIKQAQTDWDDMREAMSVVVEKVELQNNYALWPHSHIHLSSPLEPMRPSTSSKATAGVSGPSDVLWTHAKSVVASLRTELEAERAAHICTREHAESEILSLTAALARREAELEACVVDHAIPTAEVGPTSSRPSLPRRPADAARTPSQDPPAAAAPPPFTRQDALRVLEISAARNRALEIEVRALIDRLEQARARAPDSRPSSSPEPQPASGIVQQPQRDFLRHPFPREPPLRPPVQLKRLRSGPTDSAPRSPGLPPVLPAQSPSPYTLSPQLSAGPSTPGPSLLPISSAVRASSPDPALELPRLEHEIKLLAVEIDAFRTERGALRAALADDHQRQNAGTGDRDGEGGMPLVLEECMRLITSVDALRCELEAIRDTARHGHDPDGERVSTPIQPSTPPPYRPPGIFPAVPAVGRTQTSTPDGRTAGASTADILTDDGDERSMELATPLQPTILSLRDDTPEARVSRAPEPPDIPLPDSPSPRGNLSGPDSLLAPSPRSSPPRAATPGHHRAPDAAPPANPPGASADPAERLALIKQGLARARLELEDKDAALQELRAIVEELRHIVETGDAGAG